MDTQTKRLDTYANIIIRVGVNIQPGQALIIQADIGMAPMVRALARASYAQGGGTVTPLYSDRAFTGDYITFADDAVLEQGSPWLADGVCNAFRDGAARIALIGEGPIVYPNNTAPDTADARLARITKSRSQQMAGLRTLIMSGHSSWCVAACPTPAWATQVFPDLPAEDAIEALWAQVLHTVYADTPDPVARWAEHNAALHTRAKIMNAHQFKALHFLGDGTDLTVGLADGHTWIGGAKTNQFGHTYNANIPTEEVFTTPHKDRVDGYVRSTKPLYYANKIIEGIRMRFKDGKVIEAHADTHADTLQTLIDTDAGACRLGEVALVPHHSPIAESGVVFFETLFDENASCHIAMGQAYDYCQSPDESGRTNAERGANTSRVHVDWMIGNVDTIVDGILPDGTRVPLIRNGTFIG